jgi:hypothetical protein
MHGDPEPMPRREKHLPYFTVLEALQQAAACPLCTLELDAARRYLHSVLRELVNDPGVRRDLAHSRGYCHRHAHVLATFHDGLGTAILYRDQLSFFLEFLEQLAGAGSGSWRKRDLARWKDHPDCPACRVEHEARDRTLSVLVEELPGDEMRSALVASAPWCVPHFLLLYERVQGADDRRFVVEAERRKVEALRAQVADFIARHDYRRIGSGFGDTGDSWLRAVSAMVGLPGTCIR